MIEFKYTIGQKVRFSNHDGLKVGTIERSMPRAFTAWGTPPFYDIYVEEENCIYQDVSEAYILNVKEENKINY